MQESPELHRERELARRDWKGCLFTFGIAAIVIVLVTMLPLGIFTAQSQPTWVLVLFALGGLAVSLLLAIGAVVLMVRITAWTMEGERQKRQRGTAVLQRTLPSVPTGPEAPAYQLSAVVVGKQMLGLAAFAVGITVVYVPINVLIRWLVPDAPGITSLVAMLALGAIILYVWPSVRKARPLAVKGARPLEAGRLLAGILYVVVILVPTFAVIPLIGYLSLPVLVMPVVALGLCSTVFMATNAVYALAPVFWIQAAVKRCDYDRALARARLAAENSFMPGFYRNLAGVVFLWAGRYEEARETFEQSIGETRQTGMGAGSAALENVGCALAWQGKYAEAIPMFEGSIKISQDQVMVYSDLAEMYLRQGTELPRALQLTERALKNQEHEGIEARLLARHQTGQILATRAWALAEAGRRAEATEMLARAFAEADKSFKPVLAGVYWRAGQVMLAFGKRREAQEYFAQGQRIDPRGHYGRLCAEGLASAEGLAG